MTPTERVLEERAKHLADEINKGHYVTVDDLLEQFTLTRREALLEAAKASEEHDCRNPDHAKSGLSNFMCQFRIAEQIRALADKESE